MRPLRSLLAAALALAAPLACKPAGEPPAPPPSGLAPLEEGRAIGGLPDDAGHLAPVIIVLSDAGPDAVAAAEAAVRAQMHHTDAPPVRLDLAADLLANDFFGVSPGDPEGALVKKLGAPSTKKGDAWRWPALGVEALIKDGRVARIALHARARAEDPDMKIFLGEVLLGNAALTQKAPDLVIKQIATALGVESGRGQMNAVVSELSWRRGNNTLFLSFDNDTLHLEAIVLEGFNREVWDAAKPLVTARQIWEVDPSEVVADRARQRIEFAQFPKELDGDLGKMGLLAAAQPRGKLFFDSVQSQFLNEGETLRRVKGGRVAMLRARGCTYAVIERPGNNTWEARNGSGVCKSDDQAAGLDKLRAQFAPPPVK